MEMNKGKIKLYHGTSLESADKIMREGFKDRVSAGVNNWEGNDSQAGFVYFTRAYPFFYGMSAAKDSDDMASVLMVEVDAMDMCPDEDFLRYYAEYAFPVGEPINLKEFQHYGRDCLEHLGNVAVSLEKIPAVIGRKDFSIKEMCQYSDPSMSPLNYKFCGQYYRDLTDKWWNGGDWKSVSMVDSLRSAINN